ncbi:MAG: indolepyruvate oxidoreductase subunit beta [Smithellaceae bacterium]|nr:indolepyruvate oxidoreductase subunit beta [Smithellaceae bacterium]
MEKALLTKDPYNLIITGVGGQGNVLASRLLAGMLVRQGFRVTVGETFGVSQRGGSVMSHVRISANTVWSPQIPRGHADLVVTLEPIEAIRVLAAYGNRQVKVLTNTRPVYPAAVIAGQERYPAPAEIREAISGLSAAAWFIDATSLAMKLGNPILANIIMIGALAGLAALPLSRDGLTEIVKEMMTQDKLEANLQAFDLGLALMGKNVTADGRGE